MSIGDVTTITTKVPTSDNLVIAESVIELYAGAPLTDPAIFGAHDTRVLRKAIAFQAVWLSGQVEYTSRSAVSSQSADGASVSAANQAQMTLAPLAALALRQLSWRNGSIVPRSEIRSPNTFLTEDGGTWTALTGSW